jgi:hypothetical protein
VAVIGLGLMISLAVWQLIDDDNPKTQVVVAYDGGSEIEAPTRWKDHPPLLTAGGAQVRLADPVREEYLVVVSEAKKDFPTELTASGYADACLTQMRTAGTVRDLTIGTPVKLEINGRAAVQYDVSGTSDAVPIGYVITFIEGKDHYYEVLAWTLKSRFDSKRPLLVRTSNTFRER